MEEGLRGGGDKVKTRHTFGNESTGKGEPDIKAKVGDERASGVLRCGKKKYR